MVGNKRWSKQEREALKQHFHAIPSGKMTELISGRSERAIRDAAGKMGLKKCHERLSEMGRENVNVRWNKAAMKQPPDIQA